MNGTMTTSPKKPYTTEGYAGQQLGGGLEYAVQPFGAKARHEYGR
jgi:hypothetical protein